MRKTLFTYVACNDIFRTRLNLNNHVRRNHQSVVKIKFQTGRVAEVKRVEDNTFKCKCGRGFKLPNSNLIDTRFDTVMTGLGLGIKICNSSI